MAGGNLVIFLLRHLWRSIASARVELILIFNNLSAWNCSKCYGFRPVDSRSLTREHWTPWVPFAVTVLVATSQLDVSVYSILVVCHLRLTWKTTDSGSNWNLLQALDKGL